MICEFNDMPNIREWNGTIDYCYRKMGNNEGNFGYMITLMFTSCKWIPNLKPIILELRG